MGNKDKRSLSRADASEPSNVGAGFVEDVRVILRRARGKAYAAVNSVMVEAYWRIGRRIVEEEQGARTGWSMGRT